MSSNNNGSSIAAAINLPAPSLQGQQQQQQNPDGSMAPPPPPPPYQPMEGIPTPHHNDVLCGRGVTTNRHPGNENFRGFVNRNKALYVTSTKRQKMTISRSIVEAVRNLSPPGRFLEKDVNTGLWSDIGDKKAVEKTSQALRDGAASLRKLLSDDLNDPDVIGAFCEDPKNMEAKLAAKRKALKEKALRAAEAVNSPKQETTPGALMMDSSKSPSPGSTMQDQRHHPVVSPSGSEISPSQYHPHHHHGSMPGAPHHHPHHPPPPPRHGNEYDSHYNRYQDPHHDQHHHHNPTYDYQGHHGHHQAPPHHYSNNQYPNHPYQGSGPPGSHPNMYKERRRGHNETSPPRRRVDRYQEMDISPPPSPRIEHSHSSRSQRPPTDHHSSGSGGYWSGMNKDGTSSLFRELKHHASNSMIRDNGGGSSSNASRSSYDNRHHPRSSYRSQDMNRFPSPPHNRTTPTNFVEVTQEGFYQCSSSRGTVTGRFRNSSSNDPYYQGGNNGSSPHPYETRTPNGYNSNTHGHGHDGFNDNGLVTPSPTRNKLMSSGGAFHDTKKYFEPPPPQRSRHHHSSSHHRSSHSHHHHQQHHYSQQYHHDDYNNRHRSSSRNSNNMHDDYNRSSRGNDYQDQYYSPHQYPVPPPPDQHYDNGQQQPSPEQTHHHHSSYSSSKNTHSNSSSNNNPTITPSPKNRNNVVYHQHEHHSSTTTTKSQQEAPPTPPNPNMFKDPFASLPPTPPSNTNDAFDNNSFKSQSSTDAWLTDSPIFLPMDEDLKQQEQAPAQEQVATSNDDKNKRHNDNTTNVELENRTHSDTSHRSSSSCKSMKSDVTPLPYRSSPTASFSPFLGYLCCGPSFCEQQATNDINIQPWCPGGGNGPMNAVGRSSPDEVGGNNKEERNTSGTPPLTVLSEAKV